MSSGNLSETHKTSHVTRFPTVSSISPMISSWPGQSPTPPIPRVWNAEEHPDSVGTETLVGRMGGCIYTPAISHLLLRSIRGPLRRHLFAA